MIRARCQYQYSVCLFLSYRLGTKQPVCLGGVTVLYACAPRLRLELAVSVWQGGLGAGPLAHSQELPAQCFFLLKLPEEPELTAQNGLSLDRLPGRFGSDKLTVLAPETSAPSPRNEYSAGEPEAGVQILVFYSNEKRLSWICLHEPMCTTSFYVKL